MKQTELPDRAEGCGFPVLRGVIGPLSFFSLRGVVNESLAPVCFSSELDPKSNAVFFEVVAFFSARLALDSRKAFNGDAEGVLSLGLELGVGVKAGV